jgi:hypothetical protein
MRIRQAGKLALGLLTMAALDLAATPAEATLTPFCNWSGSPVHSSSNQVMMMPIVMDFHSTPSGTSQVAFISFAGSNTYTGGVLRIIDANCGEIARFPDTVSCPPMPVPPLCPTNLYGVPQLEPVSGLAAGTLDSTTTDRDIVGVLDNNRQIIAFNLVGTCLRPKWCSPPRPPTDLIFQGSAPAIAQLDNPILPTGKKSEVIIDNKVYGYDGSFRFSGGSGPRSRTAVVSTRLVPSPLAQVVITGGGLYKSSLSTNWTGISGWPSTTVTNSALVYPAVAELDSASPGPEVVVTDTMAGMLRVLSAAGVQLASLSLPNNHPCSGLPTYGGGPPMIGNTGGGHMVIGVATCSRYTLFKYLSGGGGPNSGTLTPLWSNPIKDPSGEAASTFYNNPLGNTIYYNDSQHMWVFNAANGNVLQMITNSSATFIEGPVIASFSTTNPVARVVVAASDYAGGAQHGVRIFSDPSLGMTRGWWNQHTYHVTNVTNSSGAIPALEIPNWATTFRNTYRAQQP